MTALLPLSSPPLAADVDPAGAEVRSLRLGGRELLFRSPWDADPDVDRGLDDTAWVRGWAGGWALLFPNAGPAGEAGGVRQPYHGEAALSAWDVGSWGAAGGTLRAGLLGGQVRVTRDFRLAGAELSVGTRVDNTGPADLPYVAVEHVILGEGVLGPGATVDLPSGDLVVLDAASSPPPWRSVPAPPAMWFGAVRDARGPARVHSSDGAVTVTLSWEAAHLPHLWVWLEDGADPEPPWGGRVRCLGLEPASTTAADGLAGAAASLPAGGSLVSRVTLAVDDGTGR